jgi:hypothetical protein
VEASLRREELMRLATTEAALEVNLLDQVNETTENPLRGKIPGKEIMKMLIVIVKVKAPEGGHEENQIEMIEITDQAKETIDDEAEAETEMMMGEEMAHIVDTQEGVIQAEGVTETEIKTIVQDQVTATLPKITLDIEEIVDKITEKALMMPLTRISPRVLRGKKRKKRKEKSTQESSQPESEPSDSSSDSSSSSSSGKRRREYVDSDEQPLLVCDSSLSNSSDSNDSSSRAEKKKEKKRKAKRD